MSKEDEIMDYLQMNVFDPILNSKTAAQDLKTGVRYTIMRMRQRDAKGMVNYYWSAIIGTERSTGFAKKMRQGGFVRFEEIIEDFRERFNNHWLEH